MANGRAANVLVCVVFVSGDAHVHDVSVLVSAVPSVPSQRSVRGSSNRSPTPFPIRETVSAFAALLCNPLVPVSLSGLFGFEAGRVNMLVEIVSGVDD